MDDLVLDPTWVSDMTQFKDEFDSKVNEKVNAQVLPLQAALAQAHEQITALQNKLNAQAQLLTTKELQVTGPATVGGVLKATLAPGSVGNAQLANKAVDTAKIKDSSVTREKLKAGAVSTDQLGRNAATKEKIHVDYRGELKEQFLAAKGGTVKGRLTVDVSANDAGPKRRNALYLVAHKDEGSAYIIVPNNRSLGIWSSTLDGHAQLYVGKLHETSTIEAKTNVTDLSLEAALEALEQLNPVTFRFRGAQDRVNAGFIAEHSPEIVTDSAHKSVSSMNIVALLTKIIQHQQEQIERLFRRLEAVGSLDCQ